MLDKLIGNVIRKDSKGREYINEKAYELWLDMEEVYEQLEDSGIQVDVLDYQVMCREGRVHILRLSVEGITVLQSYCLGCPFNRTEYKGIKFCFKVVTGRDVDIYFSKGVKPVGALTDREVFRELYKRKEKARKVSKKKLLSKLDKKRKKNTRLIKEKKVSNI